MDMSFSLSGATPLAQTLDFAKLLASRHVSAAAEAEPAAAHSGDGSPIQWLILVILGRTGWREAALVLGGSFYPEARQPL